ncbi:class I SAM-dependent methyltransferase [Cyanobium sp. ATX 6A2]|uniref:50S ribosomal protein L11 methyltransferase n=1 Tax=Cyanobium sp. ATX 6A2 TaxID=2823700 RepID=UPI0020CC0BDD|nr:50S ribosomal protein L11 methyltransferase [Cyanobium sp. ATX 6A2]MCP9888683.1 class I SAM-dependent methyltransferase [Cyanobium sp. ATX 6A2]
MLSEHLDYLKDSTRLERFRSAIAKVVDSADTVVDLGCGSGILGLLCCEAGASHVLAIDSTDIIEVARETFQRAGLDGKSTFIRSPSQRVELSDPVDLVICDHVGYFGFDYGIIHTLQDARTRLLKRGGHLIPAGLRLYLGAVESETAQAKAHGWQEAGIPPEFHWVRNLTVNEKHGLKLPATCVLGQPAMLDDLDLHLDQPEFFSWSAELPIERDGVVHGLAGWFDCKLVEGVWMTNSPLVDDAIDRPQAFLPIDEAVPVCAGDVIKATVMARPADHLIAWVVEFPASGKRFSHSTWQGLVLTPEDLVRAQPDRVPQLSREGQARMTVLHYCDGERSVHEIEQLVLREHPDLFPSAQEISRFVMQVLGKDSE